MLTMQSRAFLHTPIEFLKGVGPQRADVLKKELGIATYQDLLQHYPFRHIDRTRFYKIKDITAELPFIQIVGKLIDKGFMGEKRGKRFVATLQDDTGYIELVWFQGHKWIEKTLSIGADYVVFGKPSFFKQEVNLVHPEIELLIDFKKEFHTALQPVYSSTEKLKAFFLESKGILKLQRQLLGLAKYEVEENLPLELLEKYTLPGRMEALEQIHFPSDPKQLQRAQARIKFEELFLLQLRLMRSMQYRKQRSRGYVFEKVGDQFNAFYADRLPFELTNAQKRVIKEIRQDTVTGYQMNRLLQGDVGSGKTVVALMTMLLALDNGFQSCLMAPTEILAQQHYASLSKLCEASGVRVALLTGSSKKKDRRVLLEALVAGEIDILIGTHALIEDEVIFKNLGMVIIDEQHRFGVEQRAKLWKKSAQPPHVLVMTATPIPRTLAMTLYGDLDTSVIDELPAGRKPIQTIHRYDSHRLRIFGFLAEEIAKGRQVYIVYPLIEESEKLDLKDLMDGYESITRAFPMPKYYVSIVHGQMKAADKEQEMQRFIRGETHIMVATTVIEVGVNVPNASVMLIENAERFGLSQLHQLRGRVGRGADQSYCILLSGNKLSTEAKTRIETMVRTNDGFEIAETDLKLRGPGDLQGTRQSGMLDLHLADLAKDQIILQEARIAAQALLEKDPNMEQPEQSGLRKYLMSLRSSGIQWDKIS